MRTVTYRLADLNRAVIPLGFVGENNHTRVIFDASKVFAEYPAAVPALTVQPPQGTSYPAVVVRDGDYVHFDVSDSDLIHAGTGELQLAFVQDAVHVRTFIARTRIDRSIVPTGEIPEPLEDFLEAASAAVAAIPQEVADGVAEGFGAVTAEAETLAAGSDATAEFNAATKVLTIGVPVGADGQDGAPGADGFSPVASVTKSGDTATISITDKTGTTTATVKDGTDGQPGADGYSPSASVSKSGATATITITDKSGTTTATVSDGTPVIDDTAGSGDTDKVWSADKLTGQIDLLAPKANPVFTGSISLSRFGSTTGSKSIAVGNMVTASGQNSAAFGNGTTASGENAHSEGKYTYATGANAHAEGYGSAGSTTYGARGKADHAEGYRTAANSGSTSSYYGAHAEGNQTQATSGSAHAEGSYTQATGFSTHAEGNYSSATGNSAHAEGYSSKASGDYTHAEGYFTEANGHYAHAEGHHSKAAENYTHAEGFYTEANGMYSHVEGYYTKANGENQHVFGAANVAEAKTLVDIGSLSDIPEFDINNEFYPKGSIVTDNGSIWVAHNNAPTRRGSPPNDTYGWTLYTDTTTGTEPEWTEQTYAAGSIVKVTTNGVAKYYRTVNGIDSIDIYPASSGIGGVFWHTQSGGTVTLPTNNVEIVGMGGQFSDGRNIRTLDYNGNERLRGDVYVGCNSDSSGGTKLAKITDIPDPEDLIDDTAGEGDTDKTWSANKAAGEVSNLNTAIQGKQDAPTSGATAGKVLGLTEVSNELVPTWVSQPSVPVQDVQVNGTSVLSQGVANMPKGAENTLGVVQVALNGTGGIFIDSDGKIYALVASTNEVKAGSHNGRLLTPGIQHRAAFFGLAKAAGADMTSLSSVTVGQYPEAQKKAIRKMLGIPNQNWELIADATLDEDSTEFIVSTDLNGQAFKLSKMIIIFVCGASTTGTRDSFYNQVQFNIDEATSFPSWQYPTTEASAIYARGEVDTNGGNAPLYNMSVVATGSANTNSCSSMVKNTTFAQYIRGFRVYQSASNKSLVPAGSNIKIYGIRYDD